MGGAIVGAVERPHARAAGGGPAARAVRRAVGQRRVAAAARRVGQPLRTGESARFSRQRRIVWLITLSLKRASGVCLLAKVLSFVVVTNGTRLGFVFQERYAVSILGLTEEDWWQTQHTEQVNFRDF